MHALLTLEKSITDHHAQSNERLEALESNLLQLGKEVGRSKLLGGHNFNKSETQSFISDFSKSDQFVAFAKNDCDAAKVTADKISIKSLLTNNGLGVDGATNFNSEPSRASGIFGNAGAPATLVEHLLSVPISSGTFEYMQLNGYSNTADYQVKEGDTKAAQDIPTQLKQAQISTVASWIEASNQVLEDSSYLQLTIQNLLSYGVTQKLEDELINGTGGTGKITGLLSQATTFTGTASAKLVDLIGEAAASMENSGLNPSLLVMNRSTFQSIRSERADSGDGQYVLDGAVSTATTTLWGISVVTSSSVPIGTVILLDVRQVALLDRQKPTLRIGREAKLLQNITQILVELRAGLAVFSNGAVLKITA